MRASGDGLLGSIERAFLTIESLPRTCDDTKRDFNRMADSPVFPWQHRSSKTALESAIHVEVSESGDGGGVDLEGRFILYLIGRTSICKKFRIHVPVIDE